ncbi:MAG TPA: NHL repeat-containing protein [Verrucomicrobiae bacterium]|nr:NHL repeat-containing protein [Verrucomicrobiae bacterium]
MKKNGALFRLVVTLAGVGGISAALQAQVIEIYVADSLNNKIYEFSSAGNLLGTISSTALNGPDALAFDASGNLFVANFGGTVAKFDQNGNLINATFASVGNATGLAFDSNGNLYVADSGANAIYKYTPSGNGSLFASTGNNSGPYGLAFDSSGNLYAAYITSGLIEKFDSTGAGTTFANTGGAAPWGLAFDSSGNLYTAYSGTDVIEKFTSGGVGTVFASGGNLNEPAGLAFDSSGNLYVANANGGTLEKFASGGQGTLMVTNNLSAPVAVAIKTVPEPSVWVLLTAGAAMLWRRRNTK